MQANYARADDIRGAGRGGAVARARAGDGAVARARAGDGAVARARAGDGAVARARAGGGGAQKGNDRRKGSAARRTPGKGRRAETGSAEMGPGRRRMVRRLHVHDGIITVVRVRGPRWDHRGRYAGRGGRGGLRGGGQRARGAIEHARTCTMAPLSAFATDALAPSRVPRYPQRCHRGYPGTRKGAIAGIPVPAKVPSRVSRYPQRCHRGYPGTRKGAIAGTPITAEVPLRVLGQGGVRRRALTGLGWTRAGRALARSRESAGRGTGGARARDGRSGELGRVRGGGLGRAGERGMMGQRTGKGGTGWNLAGAEPGPMVT